MFEIMDNQVENGCSVQMGITLKENVLFSANEQEINEVKLHYFQNTPRKSVPLICDSARTIDRSLN